MRLSVILDCWTWVSGHAGLTHCYVKREIDVLANGGPLTMKQVTKKKITEISCAKPIVTNMKNRPIAKQSKNWVQK